VPTILITGAGRGLGLEFARQFAGEGWDVIATVRDPAKGAAVARLGKSVEIHLLDVSDRAAVARLARDLKGRPIDVLVCNAGIYGPRGSYFGHTDYAVWDEIMKVNVMAPMALVEALADNVAASKLKRIVTMSSGMGSIGDNSSGGAHMYRTSKAALNALAKGLAADLADRGITVITVSPGWVKTDMGGAGAPLTPKASIEGLRSVIKNVTLFDSGKFFSYDGTELPW
jgi:NAD(P)-dependent dehydrogenase (short-subunit alcohol dehydrogenase family)